LRQGLPTWNKGAHHLNQLTAFQTIGGCFEFPPKIQLQLWALCLAQDKARCVVQVQAHHEQSACIALSARLNVSHGQNLFLLEAIEGLLNPSAVEAKPT